MNLKWVNMIISNRFEMVLYLRTMEIIALCAMAGKRQIPIDFAREIHFTNE